MKLLLSSAAPLELLMCVFAFIYLFIFICGNATCSDVHLTHIRDDTQHIRDDTQRPALLQQIYSK